MDERIKPQFELDAISSVLWQLKFVSIRSGVKSQSCFFSFCVICRDKMHLLLKSYFCPYNFFHTLVIHFEIHCIILEQNIQKKCLTPFSHQVKQTKILSLLFNLIQTCFFLHFHLCLSLCHNIFEKTYHNIIWEKRKQSEDGQEIKCKRHTLFQFNLVN